MSIVKACVGALVGGIVAYFIMNSVTFTGSVLLVGLLAGLGARLFAGANRSFLTGVVAAVVAIGVVMGSSYARSVALIHSVGDVTSPAITPEEVALRMAEDEEADEEETDSADQEPVDEVEAAPNASETASLQLPSANQADSKPADVGTYDLVLNCLSPLLAYILGAGSRQRAIEESDPAVATDE